MRRALLVVILLVGSTLPAAAQRFPFERTVDVAPGATLDISTVRGQIAITVHDARQIRIDGTVTARAGVEGINLPSNSLEIAKRVAARPRIDVAGNVVRLRPPMDPDELRATTVSYEVRVPRDTTLMIGTDSGAVSVDGVQAPIGVVTQSSAIALSRLGGRTQIKTGSGAVTVDRASGGLRVATQSSAITLRALSGPLEARTQSGAIRAAFAGAGSAEVETGSSAIQLDGLSGRLSVRTQSGRVELRGTPTADWDVTTGSGLIQASFPPAAKFTLEATSSTSDVKVAGLAVDGSQTKGRASGTVGGGGPTVRLASRSGQVHVGR
jgi:DUF4097 and DUF4098 domain-containing protein YvlB